MYVGFNRIDRRTAIEAELGRPLSWLVTMADRSSPSDMRASVRGQVAGPGRLDEIADRIDLVVTVPLTFGKGSARTSEGQAAIRAKLLETAAGTWDGDYRNVAQTLADNGYGDAVIRLGHEFTGGWYPWSAQGNPAQYVAAFRHVHDVFTAVSPKFRFEWNAARNTFVEFGPPAYPGDTYVDLVGLDVYYEPWKGDPEMTDAVWARRYQDVLEDHRDFAIRHGKPVSYAEWGNGDIDHPDFVKRMHGWFASLPTSGPGHLEYQAYFNSQKEIYDLAYHPRSKEMYIDLFVKAAGGPVEPGPTTTVPVVSTVPATTAPPTTAPATTVPATTVPATTVPATTVPATTVPATGKPEVSMRAARATEGDKLVFKLVLTKPTKKDVVVRVKSTDVSALSRVDYRPVNREVVIPAGQIRGFVGVATLADSSREGAETMRLAIVEVDGAAIDVGQQLGTIVG
jgi:hypothetical protein